MEDEKTQPFPAGMTAAVQTLNEDALIDVVWQELEIRKLGTPFSLPAYGDGSYSSVSNYVETEIKLQAEMMRDELHKMVNRVEKKPKEGNLQQKAEKHLRFYLPSNVGTEIILPLHAITKEPICGRFTNYVYVLQTLCTNGDMRDLCLAFCKRIRKSDGGLFSLGKKDRVELSQLSVGTTIYARPLRNYNMLKTHIRAIAALKNSEADLNKSYVMKQLLQGRLNHEDVHNISELENWINSKSPSDNNTMCLDLTKFNTQQQHALALEALTPKGVVLIQGPPGTGKSHTICNGILPQVTSRNEKVLVVCNSNVTVDSLVLKCYHDNVNMKSLRGNMKRLGFKQNVSDEIVNLGLYAEGNECATRRDAYGNTPGANSNTADDQVQSQIRSAKIVFTTIHYASKEKEKSKETGYWNFDTLVLDEAAQIEDSKLFIILARCPSLNKMILVGDPKQLQPYVPDSLRFQKHGKSTMERMMDNAYSTSSANNTTAPYIMLEEQFRMPPSLRAVVSSLYYNNRLRDGPNVIHHGPIKEKVDLKPLLVINVTGTKMIFNRLHQSYENKAEAEVVKIVYNFLLSSDYENVLPPPPGRGRMNDDISHKDICILTPYNRHKDCLRMLICDIDEDVLDSYAGQTYNNNSNNSTLRSRGLAYSQSPSSSRNPSSQLVRSLYLNTPSPSMKSPQKTKSQSLYTQDDVNDDKIATVENIDTVDKFQGSERKVVIISTCVDKKPLRSADPHFINVACSRAQHQLVVIGNFTDGLSQNPDWMYVKDQAMKSSATYLEHHVTMTNPQEYVYDIHENELQKKLKALVERPKKKPYIDF